MTMRTAIVTLSVLLSACDPESERLEGQYPITRAELEAHAPADSPAEADYRRVCLPCHGVDGTGAGGRLAADLTSQGGPLSQPDEILVASVRDGKRGSIGVMPPHDRLLSDDAIRAVVAYVRERFGPGVANP
jgi:mono/diheme cytochrome c family protein